MDAIKLTASIFRFPLRAGRSPEFYKGFKCRIREHLNQPGTLIQLL